jgi:hypothetical protein
MKKLLLVFGLFVLNLPLSKAQLVPPLMDIKNFQLNFKNHNGEILIQDISASLGPMALSAQNYVLELKSEVRQDQQDFYQVNHDSQAGVMQITFFDFQQLQKAQIRNGNFSIQEKLQFDFDFLEGELSQENSPTERMNVDRFKASCPQLKLDALIESCLKSSEISFLKSLLPETVNQMIREIFTETLPLPPRPNQKVRPIHVEDFSSQLLNNEFEVNLVLSWFLKFKIKTTGAIVVDSDNRLIRINNIDIRQGILNLTRITLRKLAQRQINGLVINERERWIELKL